MKKDLCEAFVLGLADRFKDYSSNIPFSVPSRDLKEVVSKENDNPFSLNLERTDNCKPKIDSLKEQLFEKIVTIPCWFEYDSKTQYELIVRFLELKGIKNPQIFAKVLQHSILGFGIFDEYLANKEVSSIFYEEGEPLLYIENDRNVVDTKILPFSKVQLAVQNIINMSQATVKNGFYNFRIGNFWIQLKTIPHSKLKLSVSKITEEFLNDEIEKTNISLLLSDI